MKTRTTPTAKPAPRGSLRAIVKLSLRKSPDRKSPLWGEWFEWEEGTVFTPPPHMNVARALARGIAEVPKPKAKAKEATNG